LDNPAKCLGLGSVATVLARRTSGAIAPRARHIFYSDFVSAVLRRSFTMKFLFAVAALIWFLADAVLLVAVVATVLLP
jgi:hypothetical protein